MSRESSNGVEAQGAETQKVEIPSIQTVKKWIERDLGSAITLLQGIQHDRELRDMMAQWLLGRIENAQNKKAVSDPKQSNLFPEG